MAIETIGGGGALPIDPAIHAVLEFSVGTHTTLRDLIDWFKAVVNIVPRLSTVRLSVSRPTRETGLTRRAPSDHRGVIRNPWQTARNCSSWKTRYAVRRYVRHWLRKTP